MKDRNSGNRRVVITFRNSARPLSPSCLRLLHVTLRHHTHCSVSHSGCSGWLNMLVLQKSSLPVPG